MDVQAGAIWGDVAAALSPHVLVLTSGNMGDTGVGGLATAGGIGYFVREHGLTIDHITAATLVTADGTVHRVDADHEPDLFWALRGGVTQPGVVTDFTFAADRVGSATGDSSVIVQRSQHLVDSLPQYVQAWGDFLREAPTRFTSFLMIQPTGDGRTVAAVTNVWAGDDPGPALPVLEGFAELAPLLQHEASVAPYAAVVRASVHHARDGAADRGSAAPWSVTRITQR